MCVSACPYGEKTGEGMFMSGSRCTLILGRTELPLAAREGRQLLKSVRNQEVVVSCGRRGSSRAGTHRPTVVGPRPSGVLVCVVGSRRGGGGTNGRGVHIDTGSLLRDVGSEPPRVVRDERVAYGEAQGSGCGVSRKTW